MLRILTTILNIFLDVPEKSVFILFGKLPILPIVLLFNPFMCP